MDKTHIFSLVALFVFISLLSGCFGGDELDGNGTGDSGGCGSDLTWTYSGNQLMISGTGNMDNYSSSSSVPWKDYKESITSLVIDSGVTSIGSYAFSGCSKIVKLELPSGLKTIGEYSFSGCEGVVELTVPSGVSYIDPTAFNGCTGVTVLKYQTANCDDFKQDTTPFSSLGSSRGMSVELKNGISKIPAYLFCGNSKILQIEIPDSVKTYGAYCFKDCTGLSSISISTNVTSMGAGAFDGCSGINKVYFDVRSNVDYEADTSPLLSISSESGFSLEFSYGASYVPAYIAYGNQSLTTVIFSNSTQKIGDNAFNGCKALKQISIPQGLTNIGSNAFSNCTGVESITYNAKNLADSTVSPFSSVCNSGGNTNVTFGTAVQRIPSYLFNNCDDFVFDAVPSSVTSVGDNAFAGTTSLIDLSETTKLTAIGSSSFRGCKINWIIPSTFTNIPGYAFQNTSGMISLADGSVLESIGSYAFSNSSALTSIIIPSTVKSIGDAAFEGCSNLLTVTYCTDKIASFAEGSNVFNRIGGGDAHFIFSNLSVPANILNGAAFSEVVIGDDVRSIRSGAFRNMGTADTVISGFGADSNIVSVGDQAFAGSYIKSIYFNDNLQELGRDVFSGCSYLTDVYYIAKNSAISFGDSLSAAGPPGGFTLHIGDGVETIPAGAFAKARISELELNKVIMIGSSAFSNIPLKSIVIPESVKEICSEAFSYNSNLTQIVFLSGETFIGKNAFFVDQKYLDTNIECFRKAVQNDYQWVDDNRNPHFHYVHQVGEYDGMMEVVFNLVSPILGYGLTNEIIDFFIDAYSLKAIESIDLGSDQANLMLLILIAMALLAILFVSLYFDKDEVVRIVEILLAFVTIAILTFSIIRKMWTSPDYMDWAIPVTLLILLGTYPPIIATYNGITIRREPYEGEHLVKLYTQDILEWKRSLFEPWTIIASIAVECKKPSLRSLLIITIPGGVVLSAMYTISLFVYHIPALVFSRILVYVFVKNDRMTRKHTNMQVCPYCGERFSKPIYKCPQCGVEHRNLSPGTYGIHVCVCECGYRIPCTIRGKRWSHSESLCPVCGDELDVDESEPFAFAFVGAPASGKTSLIGFAAETFIDRVCPRNNLEVVNIGPHDIDELIHKSEYESILPTHRGFDSPYSVKFQPISKSKVFQTPKALYFFDSSGDEFVHEDDIDSFIRYYRNLEGIIFVINPYDIPEFAIGKGENSKVSFAPDEILESFSRIYSEIVGIAPTEKIDVPIAIVMTRCNESGFQASMLNEISQDISSNDIIRFLEDNGQQNFTNEISVRFKNARYFATDLDDEQSDSFILPFAWLMEISNPILKGSIKWSEVDL